MPVGQKFLRFKEAQAVTGFVRVAHERSRTICFSFPRTTSHPPCPPAVCLRGQKVGIEECIHPVSLRRGCAASYCSIAMCAFGALRAVASTMAQRGPKFSRVGKRSAQGLGGLRGYLFHEGEDGCQSIGLHHLPLMGASRQLSAHSADWVPPIQLPEDLSRRARSTPWHQ